MENKIRIIIAEHDVNDLDLILHELDKGLLNYVTNIVRDEMQFVSSLNRFNPDLILSDYSFPTFSGPDAFLIRQTLAPDKPFIFVSGTIGEEKAIELIKKGVTDYVLKDNLASLVVKIIRALKESDELKLRRQVILDLGLSEALLARAQQVAHIGHWELNYLDKTIRCSNEASRIHGLMPGKNEYSLDSWRALINTNGNNFLSSKIKTAGACRGNFSFRYSLMLADETERHVSIETKTEYDATGKFLGLYGTAQDITQLVLLENKLLNDNLARNGEVIDAVLTAQETERAKIGKELHENFNQTLGATKLYIELAKHDPAKRQLLLEKSSKCIAEVIDEIRKLSKTLAKPGIHSGLFNCIQMLIADIKKSNKIIIHFREVNISENQLNENLKLTIFRIVQEQVNNIVKHSGADKVLIRLTGRGNDVILLISDNGLGTDQQKKTLGVGIQNIRSRSDLYNGSVAIISKPGKGYSLRVSMSMSKYMNKGTPILAIPVI